MIKLDFKIKGDWDKLNMFLTERTLLEAYNESVKVGAEIIKKAIIQKIKSSPGLWSNVALTREIRMHQGNSPTPPLIETGQLIRSIQSELVSSNISGIQNAIIGASRRGSSTDVILRLHDGFTIKWTRKMILKVAYLAGQLPTKDQGVHAFINRLLFKKEGTITKVKARPFMRDLVRNRAFRAYLFDRMFYTIVTVLQRYSA